MIKIEYERNRDLHKLTIKGHANYAGAGQDIVCASVTALSLTLAEFINNSHSGNILDFSAEKGRYNLFAEGEGEIDAAFKFALLGFSSIAEKYPENVTLNLK